MFSNIFFLLISNSSYPTYEEWKLYTYFLTYINLNFVLILPMRNGNNDTLTNIFINIEVLILPMRNGNMNNITLNKLLTPVLILPMRNGNNISPFIVIISTGFLSYLWGMETRIEKCEDGKLEVFLSYLWGMETQWSQ